jgi:hypothetical protein
MSRFLLILSASLAVCAASMPSASRAAATKPPADRAPATTQPAGKAKLPKGFKRLFDGKTLKGFQGREKLWKVADGAICGQTTPDAKLKHNDFLYTEAEYGDFELRLKFRLRNHNSGVQLRSRVRGDYRVTGYQADIAERRYTGILYEEGGRGILADVDPKKTAKFIKKGDWNEYRIVCRGRRLQFWINGRQTVDYTEKDPKAPKKGVIAFQLHVGPPMRVLFKDIILKPLPPAGKTPAAK